MDTIPLKIDAINRFLDNCSNDRCKDCEFRKHEYGTVGQDQEKLLCKHRDWMYDERSKLRSDWILHYFQDGTHYTNERGAQDGKA